MLSFKFLLNDSLIPYHQVLVKVLYGMWKMTCAEETDFNHHNF